MEIKISISYIFVYACTIYLTCSSSLVFSQQSTTTSVLDVDGNQLQTNTKYYILPLNHGGGSGGGGLALSIRDRRYPCPPNAAQEIEEASVGLSLKIFPVDSKQPHISLYTDLNIEVMAATICVQSTVLRVDRADPFTGLRYVRSGGVLGRAGAETVANWFKIQRFGEGYKMVYCPSVCSSCRVECGEVGVYVENGRRWLGIGGQPLVIVFKKLA